MPPIPVAAVVLTYNEELNLDACLASLAGWVAELHVVDSGSTDQTLEIARRHGARVTHHPFETHARQWKWALANVPIGQEWVLGLDADQRITPELRDEIAGAFARQPAVDGFFLNRRQVFRGRWIRHGGYYPKYLLKLFRRGRVKVDEGDLVDHHFYIDGPTENFRHDLVEDNRKEDDLDFWLAKHRRYAELIARQEVEARRAPRPAPISPSWRGNPDQRVLWLKQTWSRLPRFVRPFGYFGYRYFLRLGFLDGWQGFLFHYYQGLWFRLLIDIKARELERPAR